MSRRSSDLGCSSGWFRLERVQNTDPEPLDVRGIARDEHQIMHARGRR